MVSVPPQIQLDLPSSPLLSSSPSDTAFSPDILNCLPSSPGAKSGPSSMPPLSSSSSATASSNSRSSIRPHREMHPFGIPQIMVTRPMSTSYGESDQGILHSYANPLPSLNSLNSEEDFDLDRSFDYCISSAFSAETTSKPARSMSPPTIASLVEQLERANCDFADEVRRVQNSVHEAWADLEAWKEDRQLQQTERQERMERNSLRCSAWMGA